MRGSLSVSYNDSCGQYVTSSGQHVFSFVSCGCPVSISVVFTFSLLTIDITEVLKLSILDFLCLVNWRMDVLESL